MSTLIETDSKSWRPVADGLYTQRRLSKKNNPISLKKPLRQQGRFLDLGENPQDWAEKVVDFFSKEAPDALKTEVAFAAALVEATKKEPAPKPVNPETPPALRGLMKAGKAMTALFRQGRRQILGPANIREAVFAITETHENYTLVPLLLAEAKKGTFNKYVRSLPTGRMAGLLKQAHPLNQHIGREDIRLGLGALTAIGRLCTAAKVDGFTLYTTLPINREAGNLIEEKYIHRYITQAALDAAGVREKLRNFGKKKPSTQDSVPH